jgi:DNA-directed RNA polymerase beta subunit
MERKRALHDESEDRELQDRDSLQLLKTFLNERNVDYHHLTTYNHELEQSFRMLTDVTIDPIELRNGNTLHIKLGAVYFKQPVLMEDDKRVVPMTPKLARARCESYNANMYVDVHVFTARTKNIRLSSEVARMGKQ